MAQKGNYSRRGSLERYVALLGARGNGGREIGGGGVIKRQAVRLERFRLG